MTVVHVVPSLALRHGGVSVSVRELCQGLAQAGVAVRLLTTPRAHDPLVDGPADDHLRAAGVAIRYMPVHPWRWLGQRYAYGPAVGEILRQAIGAADLVHIHALWLYPTAAAARLCRRARVPYVLSPCGALDPYSLRRRRLIKRLYALAVERRTLAGAARVHFTSALEQRHADRFGTAAPAVVIPCSVPPGPAPAPGQFRAQHPEVGDRRLLLFLGRVHPKKRLDLVAEVFCRLAPRYPDLHLVVAGPDQGGGAAVRARLRRAGLLARATFTGLVAGAEKGAALRDSTLFLLPSEEENFGITVLEAMAAGVPVLLSPHVGVGAAVVQSQCGLIVPLEPAAWEDAVSRLLDDAAARAAMGAAGRAAAHREFHRDQVALAMQAVYEAVLRERGPRGAR